MILDTLITESIAVFLLIIILSGVRLSPLGTAATVWLTVPAPDKMMNVEQSV
jgi:hypothetical protein